MSVLESPVLDDIFPASLLEEMLAAGYVRRQTHPELPLSILNYSEKAAYDAVWNEVTLNTRGLIHDEHGRIVARPFPKFFNYGQPGAPELTLTEPVRVTDKLDGSLGILYPTPDGYAVATRGSFTSDQALHATDIWRARYADVPIVAGFTYLFEICYPQNRIVVNYGTLDDLVLLAVLDTATGRPAEMNLADAAGHGYFAAWTGPVAETFSYETLADALAAEPRDNCEGYVVYFPDSDTRLKIKQDDYVALHRILTGTNARNVWEVAAVKANHHLIQEEKHWGSFLGIDPARAAECWALGDEWLAEVPDEFHEWVRKTTADVKENAETLYEQAFRLAWEARAVPDRRARFEMVSGHPLVKEIMQFAADNRGYDDVGRLWLRAWREACPAPEAPFARTEDIA